MEATLVFPHQLFKESPALRPKCKVYIVEEYLFFKQYGFHKQKIAFHRASMQYYYHYLSEKGFEIDYVNSSDSVSDIRELIIQLKAQGIKAVHFVEVEDQWLKQRLFMACRKQDIVPIEYPSPTFVNTTADLENYLATLKPGKRTYFQTHFYIHSRKRHHILLDHDQLPLGGKWTFDSENRHRYPANMPIPEMPCFSSKYHDEAINYVNSNYKSNIGELTSNSFYPITHQQAEQALNHFLQKRFEHFGSYQDAIVQNQHFLHHSALSVAINAGLLTPRTVMDAAIAYASEFPVPINSLEGFIRQILGWREFIRMIYRYEGNAQRTTNFWGFDRRLPETFYTATTGIAPVDDTIKKILKTGYAHHIERLMILGNFMLLCRFHPDDVYRWFMEMFIDAYDWVMVPNVYGMSQFADGGVMCTKPYISGSNYIFKMSNYKKSKSGTNDSWDKIWDALFWNFMNDYEQILKKNPRLSMLITSFHNQPKAKQENYISIAKNFLNQ